MGNPEGRTSPGRSPWVGRESRPNIDAKHLETGHSPRDRGSRFLRPQVCRRSIPALAGDTRGTALRASLDYGSSPRGRGNRPSSRLGSNPARAGFQVITPGPPRVYPRTRGEVRRLPLFGHLAVGLPPHARGSATEIRLCSSVYPRTRGETLHWRRWSTPAFGETVDQVCSSPVNSPRVRGDMKTEFATWASPRSIPARAGLRPSPIMVSLRSRVDPRARGVTLLGWSQDSAAWGQSPHVRGSSIRGRGSSGLSPSRRGSSPRVRGRVFG